MAVYYDKTTKKFTWTADDLYGVLEDEYWKLVQVLAEDRLDGHDITDQWLMKVETRMRDLLDTLEKDTRTFTEHA